jgi:tyrosyl-tRNA synthetase
VYLLTRAGSVGSTSEARRLIEQGAVSRDGERITDSKMQIPVGSENIYKVGKRHFWRIRVDGEKS